MRGQLQILFLTGQSDPRSCELSQVQATFLRSLMRPGVVLRPSNFPYNGGGAHTVVPMWRASVANSWQFIFARRSDAIRSGRAVLMEWLDDYPQALILAGSCGLELFNALSLTAALERRCTVLAYGPVAWARPRFAHLTIVQGNRDILSKFFFPHADILLSCSHLDYLYSPEFLRLASDHVAAAICTSLCDSTL